MRTLNNIALSFLMLIEDVPVPKVHAPEDLETDMTVLGKVLERVQIMLNKDAFLFVYLLLLLQVIPLKVNYNYFTLYKASSLNLKII